MQTHSRSTDVEAGASRPLTIAFFVVTIAALLVLVTKAQTTFLPAGLATQVGHNSEVLVLAPLLVAAVLARRSTPAPRVGLHVVVAVVLAAVGVLLFLPGMPPTVRTLNEPVFAGALLWLYVLPRRPLRAPWVVSLVLLVIVVIGYQTSLITAQAENLVALILAPLTLDVLDRVPLDPGARDDTWRRWVTIAFLLLIPVLLIFVKGDATDGLWADIVKYPSRGTEAFWGLALAHFYFALALPDRSRG